MIGLNFRARIHSLLPSMRLYVGEESSQLLLVHRQGLHMRPSIQPDEQRKEISLDKKDFKD